jgi:glutamine synthetase
MTFHELMEKRKEQLQELQKTLVSKGASFINIHVPETNGVFRSKTAPVKLSCRGEAINGIFYCVSHSDGMPLGDVVFASPIASDENGYPNIIGRADPATVRRHPWDPRFSSVIMNSFMLDGSPCPLDPRAVLQRQVDRARSLGFEASVAMEYEFGVFEADHSLMRAQRHSELTPWGHSYINYDLVRSGKYLEFVAELMSRLGGIDVGLSSFVTEYGYGMYEVALQPKSPLEAADDAMRFKLHLRELCAEQGMVATFMARFQPPKRESACGAHQHISLWREGGNALAAGANRLSETGQHFLAGILARLIDSHLLFRPTVNSYRRMDRQAWSPEDVSWGFENRMAAVRVITTPNEDAVRFEHRVPGADVNPYFTIAAILAAELDGLESAMALSPSARGTTVDLGLPPLPRELAGSIEIFKDSEFIGRVFGAELQKHYVTSRENEKLAYDTWLANHITDFEWRRYFIGT